MRLAGGVNWWAPAPLRRLHDRIGVTEHDLDDLDAPHPGPEVAREPALEPALATLEG
jgi:putative drug exporter of the RND superfamily